MALEMPCQFLVTAPAGCVPGQLLSAQSPDGQMVQFTVPPGYGPGASIPVAYTPFASAAAVAAAPLAQAPMQQYPMAPGGKQPIVFSGHTDPWVLLSTLRSVRIKEKVELLESLVGWEVPNTYMCSDPATGQDLFVAAEKGDGVMGILGRQILAGPSRPFNMDIALLTGQGMAPEPFLQLERPFQCTCLCFCRPEVSITNVQTGQKLGSVIDPFACCMMTFDIKDAQEEPLLEISHCPCDPSLLCWGCPCGCQEVDFEVRDKKSGDTVGHIKKQFRAAEAVSMLTGVGCDADMYTVEFGDVQAAEWKALILATALFLDYTFFETGGSEQREQSVLGKVLAANRE